MIKNSKEGGETDIYAFNTTKTLSSHPDLWNKITAVFNIFIFVP